MGTPLANLINFIHSTPPVYLTSASEVLNEAAKRTHVLSRFIEGKDMSEMVQGGAKIKDVIMLDKASTYTHIHPNDTVTWQMPQVTTRQEASWRISLDHLSFTDHEIEFNMIEGLSESAQIAEYKRLKDILYKRMWTSMVDGMEDDLWAKPHGLTADMEDAAGKLPYSIPAFVNEETYGLPSGWTTKMGINPTLEARWRPTLLRYDWTDPDDSDGDGDGLFDMFEKALLSVNWKAPKLPQGAKYFDSTPESRQRFIACSMNGMLLVKRLLRDSNDLLPSRQDPAYLYPQFGGIDLVHVDSLATAQLYAASGSTYNTETASATTTPGNRFYFLHGEYIKPVMHKRLYFRMKKIPVANTQPYVNVIPCDTAWNLFARSLQRLALVSPGG